jgi:hypothetical protein
MPSSSSPAEHINQEHIIISIVVNIMRMFQFQLHPLTPVEDYPCAGDTNTEPSSPSSSQSSPEICDFPSKGGNRWQNGRRRRQAPRNIEQRPYHSPNHISPPHDKPMTKNDMYFALDCEVSRTLQHYDTTRGVSISIAKFLKSILLSLL